MAEERKQPSAEKLKALQNAMAKIDKDFGKGAIMRLGEDKIEDVAVIPTGSVGLNVALGVGGYPRGRVIEIYGPESSGKTTLAIHAMAETQKQGGIAAIIDDSIYCVHGGLSPDLTFINQIKNILRPTDIPDYGLLCDILWSDPEDNLKEDYGKNERGISITFSKKVVYKFLENNNLNLICRAHQVVEDGYEFFANKKLVTIFSAPNYCGIFDNCGAMMIIDESETLPSLVPTLSLTLIIIKIAINKN